MFEHQGAKLKELEDSHQQQKTIPEHMGGLGARPRHMAFGGAGGHFYNNKFEVGLHFHNEYKQLGLSVPISVILTDWWLQELGRYY
jgi:hypothetical protein